MEGEIIMTGFQSKGKGQRGNIWISEQDKNLLFSILIRPFALSPKHAFLLNAIASLALRKVLVDLIPDHLVTVKWPNDVYVDDSKIAGILIENVISGDLIEHSVIGIGLNLNQTHFALPTATSVVLESKKRSDPGEVLEELVGELEANLIKQREGQFKSIIEEYESNMRWRDEPHSFTNHQGEPFDGEIKGIDGIGRLIVEVGNELKHFNFQQIKFVV